MLPNTVSQSGSVIKKSPSKLIEDQLSGKSLSDIHRKPEIIQFLNIADYSIYPNTNVPLDEPLFKPEPTVIQFYNYEPLDTKTFTLLLRNKDCVSRRVKIIPPDSRLFSLLKSKTDAPVETGTKVAPGMVTEFVIQFTPEAKVDYSYDLIIVTEREKFIVPIRCQGQRAMISFPDIVNFNICPVKHVSEKPVIIRNVGEKPTKWVLKIPSPFKAEKSEGFLEVGQVDQVILKFAPQESRAYNDEIVLSYDTLEAYVKLQAEAQNDPNVYLSKTFIDLKKAYITLSSQDTFKIINKSEVPNEFEWRAFANEPEEKEKKNKLLLQLSQEEAEERMIIEENLEIEDEVESLDSDDSYDDMEMKSLKERKLQRALAALERKYANIRKAVEDDFMLFQDDIFKIEPQKGKIWPNSELEITVTFCPSSALHYTCTAYCNVTCSEERLQLTLEAIGIGPEAILSTTEYDIGDVFVNDNKDIPHIFIENQGAIEAKYLIVPSDTPFGSKFTFERYEGVLGTSEYNRKQPLRIKFCSDLMGEFSETFKIKLSGSSDELSLTLKGHVMPPSFKFDKEEINFGEVSYQFPYSEIVRIQNTSRVGFTYHIRVPGDSSNLKKEFDIIPSSGFLKPREINNIQIDFIPLTVKRYDMVLVVDVEGVGPDMHTLPIKAECSTPKVELIPSDSIDFGSVFLRHPYDYHLEMKNKSKLQAKFEMISQDEQSTLVATYVPDKEEGFIEPKSSSIIKITLTPQKAGHIRIPMHVKILGDNNGQPHMITLVAFCTGPIVSVLTPELDFGKVKVLEDYPLKVTLHNKSDIDAEYTAFTKNRNSCFRVNEKVGNLQPGEVREITVICCADECMAFNEILHIVVKEGEDVDVVLKARGTGTTAYCDQDLKIVDFGIIFTCRAHTRRYTIQNRGRKPQKLKWNRLNQRGNLIPIVDPAKAGNNPRVVSANTTGMSNSKDKDKPAEVYVFTVNPVTVLLQPKTQITFEFSCNSNAGGNISENLTCTSLVGNERKDKIVFECNLKGQFIDPYLQFTENTVYFKYIWQKGIPIEPLSKIVDITCGALLPANFLLKCTPPFSINRERFALEPGQSESLRVDFDPGHKYDKTSGQAVQKLQIIHQDHPQKDNIELIGEVCFPNLKMETTTVDFGCILNDTTKKVYMKMTNCSILDVVYNWTFVEEVQIGDEENQGRTELINQLFDILPVKGKLNPGETETVEFLYHASAGSRHTAMAVCSVEGGPDYEIVLSGESSVVNHQLSKYNINFGDIPYNESSVQEFLIENTGKVPFEYSINLDTLQRPGILEVSPSQGKVSANEKTKILVKITPGVPDYLEEVIQVEIAHYDPILVKLVAKGIFPALFFHLSRPEDIKHAELLDRLREQRNIQQTSFESFMQNSKNESKTLRALKFDQVFVELEAEADRLEVCEKLNNAIDKYYLKARKKAQSEEKSLSAIMPEIQEKIIAATWECNFGNMVLGKDKTKLIRLSNVGQLPVTYNFDFKQLKLNGISIEPTKIPKLLQDESAVYTVKFQSNKKTMHFGPIKVVTTIEVKNGLNYQLVFRANLTTPDFNLSSEIVDFGKVMVGTLSVAKIRMENIREVPCEWSYVSKHPNSTLANKDGERFQVNPSFGLLQPGQKCVIDVIFTPSQEKSIVHKLEFKITNNQNSKFLTVKGIGMSQNLEFIPGKVLLGPVLPYSKEAWTLVELRNTTENPIEVYSLDFDNKYKEEEEMLRNYEAFETGIDDATVSQTDVAGTQRKDQKLLYMVPRKPGTAIWKEVSLFYDKKQKKLQIAGKDKEMEDKLKSENEEEKKVAEEYFKNKQPEVEESKMAEEKVPNFIPESERHSVILWGQSGLGKSLLAVTLAEKHNRALFSLNGIVEWHLSNMSEVGEEIARVLAAGAEKKEKDIQEREKLKKARKKVEEVPIDEKVYRYIPVELFEKAVNERIRAPDCNAGVIIDDLKCEFQPNPVSSIEILNKVFGNQNLQLLILTEAPELQTEGVEEGDLLVHKEIDPKEQEQFSKEKEEISSIFVEQIVINDTDQGAAQNGKRMINEIQSGCKKSELVLSALEIVPFPVFPDPDSLPLPAPQVWQIISKPRNRQKPAPIVGFSLLTPINQNLAEGGEEPAKRMDLSEENLDRNKGRWIIEANNSTFVLIRFFSIEIGSFEANLQFEVVGCAKHFNLACSCVCQFPVINSDPRNVFMKRKKNRPVGVPECYVSKHYISQESKYEFGPLLIGKLPDKKNLDSVKKTNSESFRITNNGLYPINIDFALRSCIGNDKKSVFIFEPENMKLSIDETKEIIVWAFPETLGEYNDTLLALIEGNPKPVMFPMSCQGEKPIAEVDPELIVFERILLKQKLTKTITVKNAGKIPLKWNFAGIDQLPEEFKKDKTGGVLKPCESAAVNLTFEAIRQHKFTCKITLEVCDVENIGIKQDPKIINIEAEAFDVKVNVNFGNDKGVIDFKDVRVFEEVTQNIALTNSGNYDIKYSFLLKKKLMRDMFAFTPSEGTLSQNQNQQIVVSLKTDKEKKIDPAKDVSDIKLQILEGASGEKCEELPINVALNAVFSKYSIHPLRNINFGPLQYGDTRTRSFEIKNEGIFDFDFNITEYADERSKQRKLSPKEDQKSKPKDPVPPPVPVKKPPVDPKKVVKGKEAQSSVDIGQFTISPSSGTVSKSNSVVVSITFNAEGSKLYQKTIAINLSNRDPNDNPLGIPYDLAGESCIPGVNTWDFDMIFEEQTVIPSLAITHGQKMLTSKVFAQEENVFLFGTQVSNKTHEGISEKFKIMNCSKVPANLIFSVKPRTTSKSEGFGFEVFPPKVHILPHGYEYVKVTFKPLDMIAYGGIFEAVVEGGDPSPKTHKLSFELRGEGTLPTVSQQGSILSDDGKSLLKFPRTKLTKSTKIPITLINGGSIPASVKFEMEFHKCFKFADAMSATLPPKTIQSFDLEFKPEEVQKYSHEIKMITLNNPYELQIFSLTGEGYQEDIMFEGLEDREDEVVFGDCNIGQEKEVFFSLHNNCDNPVKFEWPERPNFVFVPSCGHLAPKTSKGIKVVFKADEPQTHKGLEFPCQTIQIVQGKEFEDWDNSMFDTKMVTAKQFDAIVKRREEEEKRKKEEFEAAQKKGAVKKPVGAPKKREDRKNEVEDDDPEAEANIEVQEVKREPNYQEIDKSQKQVVLKISATADFMRYACDYSEIRFASTLMFATRSFKFPLRNASSISMPYKFKICSSTTGRLDAGPYSVAPREGTIQAGCDEVVTVKFSPSEVDSLNERLLVCSLSNLSPDLEPLVIELKGKSARPICHFELPASNYREKKAQDMLPIDASYQILEFESMGTKVKNTKRFYVVNPTNQGYEFEWEYEEKEGTEVSIKQFKCLTPKGVVLSGKKYEMIFEYTPEFVGSHETYWKFRIPSEKLVQNFLVVGTVLEPVVLLSTGMINFNQLLLGGKALESVNIINQEIIPFSYSIDKESLKGDLNQLDSLSVSPMNGVIPPQGTLKLEVTFKPRTDTKYNFNIVINVKRKARPLVLNVKGVGYIISHSIHYENSHSALMTDEVCNVNFGSLFVNETQRRTVQIVNSGKFNFDYSWKKSNKVNYISISQEQGTVKSGETVTTELKYIPLSEHNLKSAKIHMNVVSGPKYTFSLLGSSRKPGVNFSFSEKDFGPCFVLRTIMPKTEMLEIVNYDNSAISIETLFEKLPYLDVQLAPGQVLLPTTPNDPDLEKKKLQVPIIFTPREITNYSDTITFDINNVMKYQVTIKGEGVPVKLELGAREQETIDFGIVRVGAEKTRTVQLTNKSKRSINLTLVDGSNLDELKKHAVFFTPDTEILLKPKQTVPIEITFKPKERLPPFNENLLTKFSNGETKKLLSISGACHGIELKLMEEVVSFGNVIMGSHQSKKIQLLNIGDVACNFQWDSSKYKESFTIVPESGTIQANTEIYFEVTFHPKMIANDIRVTKVQCNINGSEPLFVTLHGSSIRAPAESTKELVFDPIVRESKTQKVQVKNPTAIKWRIQPSLSTILEVSKTYWTGASVLEIQPNSTADFEITYTPLTMTGDSPHQGSLFFPLPDGTALVFNLVGISKPPKPTDTIAKEIKAKVAQILILPIKNWLEVTQRFEVKWDLEGENDPAILIRGANTIDAPGYSTKEYKLNFLTYKTGITKFKVTFTNPATKEYIFFNIEMKATQQELQGTVELVGSVREVVSKVITIANPLASPIEISRNMIQCDNDYVIIEPDWLEIPSKSESGIEVSYRPLTVTELQSKLVIKTSQLGEFNYILLLKGLVSPSQRTLNFSTSLGTELVQAFRFTNYLKKQVQYSIKIERLTGTGAPDFMTDKPLCDAIASNSQDGVDIVLPIKFEPSNLGESRALLTLSHAEGGEFLCLLNGTTSAPMPQGPYKCIPGKGYGIEFRNPFYDPMEYTIRLDNPAFSLATKSPVKLEAKKSVSIQVVYKPQEGKPSTGRMIVSTGDLPPWIYYLSGE